MRIEGRNPIIEALRAKKSVRSIKIAQGVEEKGPIAEILTLAEQAHVRIDRVQRRDLDEIADTHAHQGVIAEMDEFAYSAWEDALATSLSKNEKPLILALDGITDPQNAGSLIRSAYSFGAHAVILPARRAAPVTASVIKASAGAIWHIAIDQVSNLNQALSKCKESGLWVVALDGSASEQVSNCPLLSEPCVLVVGAEGKGISKLVLERADATVKINQIGLIGSLGAAVAGAIALHEIQKARAGFAADTQLSDSSIKANRT
ncbi:MAG: 23S rRNA (guanosine(2251)-2'-O)-methyltransferase RlmB [Actinomycetota bacterium]